MNLTGILIAGIVIQDIDMKVRILICGVVGAALTGAILFSKRGSIADDIDNAAPPQEAATMAH